MGCLTSPNRVTTRRLRTAALRKQVWWHTPVILAVWRQRQGKKFRIHLSYHIGNVASAVASINT